MERFPRISSSPILLEKTFEGGSSLSESLASRRFQDGDPWNQDPASVMCERLCGFL